MDNLILSDKVLREQVCTECLNYLSVGPVLVSGKGKIICGRCSPNERSELNQSLYNLVAEKSVFRCINYYEGCEELLNFNEAVEHERQCKKDELRCPFCDHAGNGCQLVHHFNLKHFEYVLKEDSFKIVVNEESIWRNLIFVKHKYIFCLIYSIRGTCIEFFNLLITPTHVLPKHFKLRFFKSDTNIEFATLPIQIVSNTKDFPSSSSLSKNVGCDTNSNQIKDSFSLDQTLLLQCFPSGWCLCKIELANICNCGAEERILKRNYLEKIKKEVDTKLPTNFVKEINEKNFDSNCILKMSRSELREFIYTKLNLMQYCVSCKKYITSAVYFCPKSHMACEDCSNIKCSKCDSFCVWSLKPKYNAISLPCEWNGCSDSSNVFNYMTHKRDCTMRVYKCPDVDCEFEGSLFVELKKHWHVNSLIDCNIFNISLKNQTVFWHISELYEMFRVSTEYNSTKETLAMNIWPVDVVIPTSIEFQVLFHTNKVLTESGILKQGDDCLNMSLHKVKESHASTLTIAVKVNKKIST